MDDTSEWWLWSNEKYKTKPPGLGQHICLYNYRSGTLYTPLPTQTPGEECLPKQLRQEEYQPISEEEAILIIIQQGFKV